MCQNTPASSKFDRNPPLLPHPFNNIIINNNTKKNNKTFLVGNPPQRRRRRRRCCPKEDITLPLPSRQRLPDPVHPHPSTSLLLLLLLPPHPLFSTHPSTECSKAMSTRVPTTRPATPAITSMRTLGTKQNPHLRQRPPRSSERLVDAVGASTTASSRCLQRPS